MIKDVAVIGGGVSGLATAYRLCRMGLGVVVLERQARPGGNAISESLGGFLMEHGPSAVAASAPAALAMSHDLDLDAARCDLGSDIKRRYLVKNDHLSAIPLGPGGFFRSNYLSPLGRLRLLAEAMVPRRRGERDESLADFCRRRFGREFADRVMDPLVGGVYASRAEDVSAAALFPKLVDFEQSRGSVTQGIVTAIRKGGRMPGSRLFSWRNGVGTLPTALAGSLGPVVRTDVTVRRINRHTGCFQIDGGNAGSFSARSVVVATQPHVTAQIVESVNPDLADAVSEIVAPPLAVVFLGYRRQDVDHPLDGLGYLCASGEGRNINGVQFSSTMFPGRAPEGYVAISAYFGGGRNPEIGLCSARELIDLAHREMVDLLGVRAQPVLARVRHWSRGIPQYYIGHGEILNRMHTALRGTPGLFVAGNYFNGPSVAACLALAEGISTDVGLYLGRQGRQEVINQQRPSRRSEASSLPIG